MFNRILRLPLEGKSSLFLFGPRGTGKTSWLKSHIPDALYFDLLDFDTYNTFSANPGRLESLIPTDFKNWIIIDEIQRVPELLNGVHRLIESKKFKFILTGSSARSLRRKGTNLLAGRALVYHMHPLVIQETGDAFHLMKILKDGLLPATFSHQNTKEYLKSYVDKYLREEVMQEGLTRNLSGFARFLEAASFSQGQVLNFTEIARELHLVRSTVSNYFDILDDLLIGIRILPFTKRAKRKMITHQKFYFFDVGVYQTLKPVGLIDTIEENQGAGLETVFLQSLRAINDYFNLEYHIHFWHTQDGDEVDFVIYGPRGFHAFEIKRSAAITSKSLKGLKKFGEDYPEAKLHILHTGKLTEYHGNIVATPFVEMLKKLPETIG